jgi:hypothetical protein
MSVLFAAVVQVNMSEENDGKPLFFLQRLQLFSYPLPSMTIPPKQSTIDDGLEGCMCVTGNNCWVPLSTSLCSLPAAEVCYRRYTPV